MQTTSRVRRAKPAADLMTFTVQETTLHIEREHPEYVEKRAMWQRYRHLYAGGEQFRRHADRYLVRRQKEPGDVYLERLHRAFYENYIGSIVDWYTATLFRREPVIMFGGSNERSKAFFAEFTEDCDWKGCNLAEFFRKQFVEALVCGRSHIVVDFPRPDRRAGTRAEEDQQGTSRAYLAGYSADDLINWSYDPQGQYEWVVLRTSGLRKISVDDAEWAHQTRWAYYDREHFRVYERTERQGKAGAIELIAEGRHGLANLARVPVVDLHIAEGLWLLNKAAS